LVFLNGALLQKFDLVSGLFCLVALLALIRERTGLAWSMLALATLIKGFPLLAVPIFAGYQVMHARRSGIRQALREQSRPLLTGLLAFGATIVAWTLLVWAFAGAGGIAHSILYQGNRGTEIESLYANALLLLGWIPALHVYTVFNPEDLSRIVKSSLDNALDIVSLVVLAVSLVLAYSAYIRALQRNRAAGSVAGKSGGQNLQLAGIAVAAVSLAFMLAFRALPTHYLLAIIPLAALIRLPGRRLQWIWLTALVAIAVAGQLVTIVWHALVLLQPAAVLLLTVRNCAWIAAFGALFLALWRPGTATHQSRRVQE
jgi:magnesium-transporting ATPase (P-type)